MYGSASARMRPLLMPDMGGRSDLHALGVRRRLRRIEFLQHLDGVARRDPGIESAVQGAHTRKAAVHELLCRMRGGGLIRARAVEDDVAIVRQVLGVPVNRIERNQQRAGNATRLETA